MGEAVEELGVIERAHARLLQDVEGELRGGVGRTGLVHERAFGEAAFELLTEVVAEDPRDKAVLVLEVVVERLAVLSRSLDDVADGHLLERHLSHSATKVSAMRSIVLSAFMESGLALGNDDCATAIIRRVFVHF